MRTIKRDKEPMSIAEKLISAKISEFMELKIDA